MKKKKPKCDHKGHWRRLGLTFVNSQKELILFPSIFCRNCGETKAEPLRIPLPPPGSPIKKAIMMPSMRPGGKPGGLGARPN